MTFFKLKIGRGVGTAPANSSAVGLYGGRSEEIYRDGPGDVLLDYDLENLSSEVNFVFYIAWADRVVAALTGSGCTGFEPYPISVQRKGQFITGFQGVRVTGVGGEFDAEASEAKYLRPDSDILSSYKRVVMKDGWDGNDVFLIPGLGVGVYFSQRARDVLADLKLRSAKLVKNTDAGR